MENYDMNRKQDGYPINDRMLDVLWKEIDQRIVRVIQDRENGKGFTDRKVTDTPTDALMTVNRRYVTMNGPSSQRPTASVIGQSYFDTDENKPIWWNGVSFVDSDGNVI